MSTARSHHRTLLISTLACVAVVELLYLSAGLLHVWINWPYRNMDLRLQDLVTRRARLAAVDPRLVFLADDAPSHTLDQLWDDEIAASPALKLMKRRIWSREVPALVLERLASAGARVVAFDYMYQGEFEGDAALHAALERFAGQAVIGCQFEQTGVTEGLNLPPFQIVPASDQPDERLGFVNVWPDEDGVVRRAQFRQTPQEAQGNVRVGADAKVFESLAACMVRKAGHAGLIPEDRQRHLFRYAFKGETLVASQAPRSLYGIFVPAIWAQNYANGAFFKDKIVLIGPEGRYNKDLIDSPFGVVAGPEFHLNAANALLQQEFLRDTPLSIDLLLIAGAGAVAWLCGRWVQRPAWRVVLVVGLGIGAFWGAVLLHNTGLVVPIFSPLVALFGATFSFSIAEQILDRFERARLRKTFERYVSRDVVKELLDNPNSFLNTVGGVRKPVTVLFSDVRGFTTLTESAKDPHALVAQLNEYFTEMVRIVFANHGTLDKFIGDAVMAHWGSIVSEGEATDARRAVAAALQMRRTLAQLNPAWKERGMLELQFGIGINHGEVIAGELGASGEYEKMEITVIGDAVNLASRLEGVTKTYHLDLCIGERVAALVGDSFVLRSLDLIIVKGKTKPVEIFAVLDERTAGKPAPHWLEAHEEAMRLYRQGDFATAEARWQEVLAAAPGDSISQVFLDRCHLLQKEPPEGAWSGVFEMKTK